MAGETFSYIVKTDGTLWGVGESNPGTPGSIWLNLPDVSRLVFTQLDPTIAPLNLCNPVPVNAPINIISSGDSICQGSCIDFSLGASLAPSATVSWQFIGANIASSNLKNPVNICYANEGIFPVQLIVTKGNLIDTIRKEIVVLPKPIAEIEGPDTICTNETAVLNAKSSALQYLWSGGQTTSSISVAPATNTTYTLIVVNNQCADTASKLIAVQVFPICNILGKDFLCEDKEVILSSENTAQRYLWSTGATTSAISINPEITQTYSLTIANANCLAQDTFTVNVEPNCNLLFPNAFSPNGDNVNHIFKPLNSSTFVFQKYALSIFDRFGTEIFKSITPEIGWQGAKEDVGVYFYKCTYTQTGRKEKNISGDVFLVR
jgi:gliding motility-associated-like protein